MNIAPGTPARVFNALKPIALLAALYCATSAQAFQFKTENGISGSFDTIVSYGISVRTENPDPSLIGIANGGTSRSVNEDDGDRAYKKNDVFASVFKVTHDLDVKWKNFGLFTRASYFYDFENHDRSNLGPVGRERVGRDARILDAFVSANTDIGGKGLRMRIGSQVVSWGESTFIPNGINVINSVDLTKLRIPGSELKEAFIPSTMLWASQEISKNASIEGFILGNFDKTKLDPRGSYFSNNDTVSDDSNTVIVTFGRRHDLSGPATNPVPPNVPTLGTAAAGLYGPFDPAAAVWAPRSNDRNPSDSGQYGIAFRYLSPDLNNTEFAFYHINYHNRTPVVSAIKGTPTSVLTGGPLIAGICGSAALSALCHTGTATYFAEYPENIRLYGMSFNTGGPLGIALQGEYSYRPNQPLQIATAEVILAALSAPNLITGFETIPGTVNAAIGRPFGVSAAGLVPNGTYIQGWRPVKVSQAQVTGTKVFPNLVGADQLAIVGEIGATKYHNLPKDLKFNGPAAYLPATVQGAVAGQSGSIQESGFVTDFSWGYRLVGRLDYTNSLFGSNMSPRIAFSHDVKGVSQTFNEGVKSASLGVNFEYKKAFTVDLSYTSFFGGRVYCGTDQVTNAGQTSLAAQINGVPGLAAPQGANYCSSANPLKDRDFYSVVLTYSF